MLGRAPEGDSHGDPILGDGPFFEILRSWAAEHRHGHGTTEQFMALSERVSGRDLNAFFQTWLYTPQKPTSW